MVDTLPRFDKLTAGAGIETQRGRRFEMNEATEEFRTLTDEEFQMLSEDEKKDYIKRYNEHFRILVDNFFNHTEEIKKTIDLLKKSNQ